MATDNSSDTSLQEKLQGQVASSVKEALDKSTSILSNLHHLSTYLDVISKMAGSADRVKDAHDQIQSIRADCASLLQTMYLGEIGLQSLLDMLKTNGGIGGLMPHIFSDPLTSSPATIPTSDIDHTPTLFDADESVLGKHSIDHTNGDEPSPKKSVVTVFVCSTCNHKFAINSFDPNTVPTQCRNCRDGVLPSNVSSEPNHTHLSSTSAPTLNTSSSSSPSVKPSASIVASNSNKQLKPKSTRRGKFNPLICKLCGVSFFYRRCLLRHLRENHAQVVDVNSGGNAYEQFIERASKQVVEDSTYKGVVNSQDSPHSSGLHVATVDSNMDYNLPGVSSCDHSQMSFDKSGLDQNGLDQGNDGDMDPPELPSELNTSGLQLNQPQQPSLNQSVTSISMPNSSSVTDSIIEAVQNQAILEQASALLSQSSNSIDSPSVHQATTEANSLLVQIDPPVSNTKTTPPTPTPNDGSQSSSNGKGGDDPSNFREFRCTVCNKAFDRPYRLTRHLEIHDPNRPRIPCNYCSKTFTRKDSLESHIKTVHASVYPFTCNHDGCSRSFATRSMYLNHLKVHGENKPYHCQECSDSFTLLTELKDHFKKEHPENESLRCNECFKVCLTQEELDEHRLRDHRFECESCGKVFARLAYLQTHVRVHNGESKFNCRFCSEGFNSAYSYRQHMKNHPEYRRIINVFPCHPCGTSFQEPKDLIAHYETPEHKEKAASIEGAVGHSTATSLMEGDLSVMGELMTDQIINSIVSTHAGFDEISNPQN